jgi:hypothetical protein
MAPREPSFRVPDGVVFREVAGEAVLLRLDTGTYYGLDATGARMWRLIAEHGSVAAVARALGEEYDAPEERLRRDAERLIGELVSHGLLCEDRA